MADRTLSNKLPIPRLPTRAKQKTKEKKTTKIESDRARNKTRINIGPAFERWRNLRDLKGFKLDAELATFLLDRENDFVEEAQCFSGDGETTETIPVLEASMSSLDIQDDIDEDVFNDIRNSVIDWAVYEDPENISPSEEEETIEDSFSDDSDDEDYMPPLCIRNSGVVTTGIHLEDLEAIGMDETVHDCPDNEPPEPTTLFEKVQIVEEGDIVGEPAAITYLISLKRLAEYLLLPIPLCTAKDPLTSVECRAPGPFRIDCKVRGTAVILQWVSNTRI
ncbi:uncharacterized protein [Misgurnus anguillicaudatus]|uniref:uncharacterized protein n=1 Tax=Misgurnus anguillicaudatus TaxID=75329 RepID=UPI003CCF5374